MSMEQAIAAMGAHQKQTSNYLNDNLSLGQRVATPVAPIAGEIEGLKKSVIILGEELDMLIRSIQPICRPIPECNSQKACQDKEIASPSQVREQLQSIRESVALLSQRIVGAKASIEV